MPSSNPALSDAVFTRETKAARPGTFEPSFDSPASELPPNLFTPGATPGAPPAAPPHQGTSPFDTGDTMRLSGTLSATAVIFGFLLVAAWFGWHAVTVVTGKDTAGNTIVLSANFPPWIMVSMLVAFGLAMLTIFKPKTARITAPLYAVAEGVALGGISHFFNAQYNGIVLSAISGTFAVFAVMLVLFATRTIRVTDKLRSGIIAATLAVVLLYVVALVLRLFGVTMPLLNDSGPLGIGISLLIIGIAAFNLLLDFDLIERGIAMKAPRYMEWYGAFGLVLTLVWLYLEMLRLMAKLRSR